MPEKRLIRLKDCGPHREKQRMTGEGRMEIRKMAELYALYPEARKVNAVSEFPAGVGRKRQETL